MAKPPFKSQRDDDESAAQGGPADAHWIVPRDVGSGGRAEVSTDLNALIVAVVGVAGTLTAPIVSQRLALRTRQQELDAEHRRRSEERDDERMRAEVGERRAAYIDLIAAVRAFRRTIRSHLLEPTAQTRAELEQARAVFDRSHAESQLIASKAVLQAATSTATALVAAYHSAAGTKEHSPATPDDLVQERTTLLAYIDGKVRDETALLRTAMRRDLGMSEQEP
jgi:cell division protein FtsB